jgi:hypothetical protein
MRVADPGTFYVFGWTWWPFDGAVTAAVIALIGTLLAMWFNGRRFAEAENNQTERHTETLASTERVSERENLLVDMRRAEEALAEKDPNHWVYAGVILQQVNKSPHATDSDRRRARTVMKAFKERETSR